MEEEEKNKVAFTDEYIKAYEENWFKQKSNAIAGVPMNSIGDSLSAATTGYYGINPIPNPTTSSTLHYISPGPAGVSSHPSSSSGIPGKDLTTEVNLLRLAVGLLIDMVSSLSTEKEEQLERIRELIKE